MNCEIFDPVVRALPLAGIVGRTANKVNQKIQEDYCSFPYSALACFRMGKAGSAFYQRERKSRS